MTSPMFADYTDWIPVGNPLECGWQPPVWTVELSSRLLNNPIVHGFVGHINPPLCDGHPTGRHLYHPCIFPPEWWSPFTTQAFCEQHIGVNGHYVYMFDWFEFRYCQFLLMKGINEHHLRKLDTSQTKPEILLLCHKK